MPRPARSALVGTALVVAHLTLSTPGVASAAGPGPDQIVDGAKRIGRGVEETAKGIGKTVTDGAKEVGHRATGAGQNAKPVADNLPDRAKGFGEALLGGLRYAGRTVARFFTGTK